MASVLEALRRAHKDHETRVEASRTTLEAMSMEAAIDNAVVISLFALESDIRRILEEEAETKGGE